MYVCVSTSAPADDDDDDGIISMRRVQLVSNRVRGQLLLMKVHARDSDIIGPKCVESFQRRKCDNSSLVLLLLFLFCSATELDVF